MSDKGKKGRKLKAVTAQSPVEAVTPVSRWGDWKTWLNIAFLFLTLWIAVFSIEHARWITPQPPLTLVLFLSVAVTWLLTVARLPGWVVHIVAIVIGLLVTVWQGISLLQGASGIGHLLTVTGSWLQGGGGLQDEEAKAIFGTSLVLLTWLAGYLSAWFALRRNNAWVAVCLGVVIIIVNLSNFPEANYLFFTLFLLASVLLIVQTRVAGQHSSAGHAGGYSGKSLFYLIISLFCITVLAVSLSWVTPQMRLPALQNAIAAGMPWKQGLQESGFNILNAVPSKKSVTTAAGIQELDFGQYWHESDDIKYTVKSPQPAYWQVNVYDTYNSDSWTTSPAEEALLERKTEWEDTAENAGKNKLAYEVITNIATDVVLLNGDFASAEMPVLARRIATEEVTAARSPRVLSPGESYTVRAYVSDASPGILAAAGDSYPEAITGIYLQLPPGLPATVREISNSVAQAASTPYEKVLLIDDYLSTFTYSRSVDALPEGADAVADFLFTQKKGFCVHFASAMTVMLRSVGVPARLAVGYLPGDPGKEKGEYLLRDKHYHAWTQVYFPGHGWIDFEPTPSSSESSDSRVYVDSPLVSTPDIRQSPNWYIWYLPPDSLKDSPRGNPADRPEEKRVITGRLSFSKELGQALLIILYIAGAFILAFGLTRVIRPLNAKRIWYVDRNNLASSAYDNLCRLAVMNKLVPEVNQTPLEFSSHIARIIPEQSRELDYLVQVYLENRFGPVKGKPGLHQEAEILKARIAVYNAILRYRGKVHKFFWTS